MLGTVFNIIIVIAATTYLAQHKILWLVLLAVNTPLYLAFSAVFFKGSEDARWSLNNIFHGETMRASEDEEWAGYKGWVYIAMCLALVAAEYKLIIWMFF